MTKEAPPRLVEVEWEDACGTDRWLTEEECVEFFIRPALLLRTVGYVMRDDDHCLGLTETLPIDPSKGEQWGTCIIIPRGTILKVTELTKKRNSYGTVVKGNNR